MFPDFQYLIQYLTGLNIPGLSILKTFGFFVAVAFIIGAYVIRKELKRMAEEKIFTAKDGVEVINKPVTTKDFVINGLIGFLLGFKLIGLFLDKTGATDDPINYIMSTKGHLLGGIAIALLFLGIKYMDAQKVKSKKEEQKTVKIYPHHQVADIILIAAVAGFAGAKIFNAFETWDQFLQNPIESLFSGSGLTYYGGLILATVALYFYTKKKGFSFARLCDACAPALILAYGIGRLGCQFAGDGDWGIYNSAYITQPNGQLELVEPGVFEDYVAKNPQHFVSFNGTVPHKYAPASSDGLTWLFAQNYQHNVNREGFHIAGYEGKYPTVLPAGVFPTPVYEFFACLLIFIVLMAVRKRFKFPLQLFGLYLIFNGLERFLVEKIRVNAKMDLFGGLQATQAELISFTFILVGLYLLLMNPFKKKQIAKA